MGSRNVYALEGDDDLGEVEIPPTVLFLISCSLLLVGEDDGDGEGEGEEDELKLSRSLS